MKKVIGLLTGLGLVLLMGIGSSFVIDQPTTGDIITSFLINGTCLGLALWYAKKQGFFEDVEPLWSWKRLAYVLVFYALLLATSALGSWLMDLQGKADTDNSVLIDSVRTQLPIWHSFFSSVVVAPVVEEMIFRGIVPQILFPKHQLIGLLISAVIFGFFHGVATLGEAVIYIGAGLVFGLAYYRKQSVTDSILLHLVANFLAFMS
ncbi:CPBP family intramembrane glutamic endopeptidase [Streptococcus cameli]